MIIIGLLVGLVIKKLKRGPRTTLALGAAGSLSIITGAIALLT